MSPVTKSSGSLHTDDKRVLYEDIWDFAKIATVIFLTMESRPILLLNTKDQSYPGPWFSWQEYDLQSGTSYKSFEIVIKLLTELLIPFNHETTIKHLCFLLGKAAQVMAFTKRNELFPGEQQP